MRVELPASHQPARGDIVAARGSNRALLAVILVAVLSRLPSLFDPPWVNDEGTYFAVGQALNHGYRLYSGVWENKTPAIYLLYAAVYHRFGADLFVIRLIASTAVLALVVIAFLLARSHRGRDAGLAAALLVGLLFGVPFLEGTTANAETFLALFAALGVYLGVVRGHPFASGVCLGCAVLFKAVGVFDATAVGLWFLWHDRRALAPYIGSFIAVLGALVILAQVDGILSAMLRDAVEYDLGYVGHTGGANVPWLAAAKLCLLAIATLLLRRAAFPVLWFAFAAAGALISGRLFGHYSLQVVVPLVVCLALWLPWDVWRSRALVAVTAGFVLLAALSTVTGWALAASGHESIFARRLQYYANFGRLALRTEPYPVYRSQIDDHVNRNLAIAAALDRMPPGPLLVWGNIPWVYPLSHRLPATPYTSALRDPPVPGETETLRRAVGAACPREVVVVRPALPPLGKASDSLRRHYRWSGSVAGVGIYVRDAASRCSATVIASASRGTR